MPEMWASKLREGGHKVENHRSQEVDPAFGNATLLA